MSDISIENARHALKCRHMVGRNGTDYLMRCEVLASMGNGRLKVRVFGRQNWKGFDHVSRIRYVEAHRVVPWTPDTAQTGTAGEA